MNAKIIISLCAVIAAGAFATWYFQTCGAPQRLTEDFEGGFGEWVADAEVPPDPNNPGQSVEWNITRSTDVACSGSHSLKLFINGLQDDGTVWIERGIPVKRGAQQVNLTFDFYSEQESFNTIAVVCAYAGPGNPEREEDFIVLGPANEVAGWKKYSLVMEIGSDSAEELWVAAGISVRWEMHMTYYIDNIAIEFL